ncbi:MAG TPA: hypothetical protein VGX92_01160 [Pyrinomonadaceae bacterium]|jgi:hypothetical protein|nr:hypothetical protein [Pyrinomonadaceae bacterium]
MEAPILKGWNNPCPPPRFESGGYSSALQKPPRSKKYDVEPSSFTLFAGAVKAKKANWPNPEAQSEVKDQPIATLPPENIAAIQLLDLWIAEDMQDRSEEWERIKRTIDENRLSDRKLFS